MTKQITPTSPSTLYYHGTSAKEWKEIKTEGLIPCKGKGADYWSGHTMNGAMLNLMTGGAPVHRPDSVYLTPNREMAEMIAQFTAEVNKSKPVVLEVALPPEDHLLPDEECPPDTGFRYEGSIPAACLRKVTA